MIETSILETFRLILTPLERTDAQASRRISEKSGMRVMSTGEEDFVSGRLPV